MVRKARALWRRFTQRAQWERDLDDEIGGIFAMRVAEHVRAGLARDAARRAATLEFGRVDHVKERVRDATSGAALDTLLTDLKHAARLLWRDRVVALTAIVSLTIGLGANTAVFTIANALLLRPPAGVTDADRVVDIARVEDGRALANFTLSYPYYRDVVERANTLGETFAYEYELQPVSVRNGGEADRAFLMLVTPNYFSALGVTPAAGRLFGTTIGRDQDAAAAVLSHAYWQRRFGGSQDIVGRNVTINRQTFAVIGVAAEAFRGTNVLAPDLWLTFDAADVVKAGTLRLVSRRMAGLGMGARLRPGASVSEARAELHSIAVGLEREHPVDDRATRLRVGLITPVPGALANVAAAFMSLLFGLVATVLIIACTNLAGVLLARAVARRREIAVRMAIGAGRARVVRQLVTETLVLFCVSGAGGVLLGSVLTGALLNVLPAFAVPVELSLPLDARVLALSIALTLVAAILSGIAPALHASKADVIAALKDESQGPTDRLRARSAFLVAQIACSLVLVVTAGLFVQALQSVRSATQSFDMTGIEMVTLDLSTAGYQGPAGAALANDVLSRIGAVQGIESVTLARYLPGRGGIDVNVSVPGVAPPEGAAHFTLVSNAVAPAFFSTLRIPVIAGRDFTSADRAGTLPVAIVSESVARAFWPDDVAVGKFLRRREPSGASTDLQIVGVVKDLGDRRVDRADGRRVSVNSVRRIMYVPIAQQNTPAFVLLARGTGSQAPTAQVRQAIRAIDPNLVPLTSEPLDAQSGPVHLQLRVAASVAAAVGFVGLLLAAIGVFGVATYTTSRRTREIGVRIALGARRAQIVAMVLGQGMRLVFIGAALGLAAAAASSQLLTGFMFGAPTLDLGIYLAAAVLFGAVGLLATYLPARRASRTDPTTALRYE